MERLSMKIAGGLSRRTRKGMRECCGPGQRALTLLVSLGLIGLLGPACGTRGDEGVAGDKSGVSRALITNPNLVANPSLEVVNPAKPTEPANWQPAKWGTNTVTFKYDDTDAHTGTRSVRIDMPSWSSGDAKWIFDSVAVTPGTALVYSDSYKSTVTTKLVAAYQMTGGTMQYLTIATAPARATWSTVAAKLVPPAGATRVTVYHLIAGVGTLQIDDASLALPQSLDLSSGVPNGSFEQASDMDPAQPLAWHTGGWGSNSASFAYLTNGRTGSRSVSVTVSNFVSGDAKWYFDPQPVTPGLRYQYSDFYIGNVPSVLFAQLTMDNKSYQYITLAQVAAASSFTQVKADFLVPTGAVAVTIFHALARNGTLQIDDAALAVTAASVDPPTLSPGPGSYTTDQSVSMSCGTVGATIHYTSDGSEPTASSPVYSTPISIVGPNSTVRIRAIAIKDQVSSTAVDATYTVIYPPVSVAAPTLSPAPGTYLTDQSVTLSCETSGAIIHYTSDGSEPTASSPVYSTPISIVGPNSTLRIRAIAIKDQVSSTAIDATYTVSYPVAAPTFSPAPSTYPTDQNVTLSCATVGATIHYTSDGSEPTAASPVYSTPVSIKGPNSTVRIRAIATKDQASSSAIDGTFTVSYPPPAAGFRPTPKIVFTFDTSGAQEVWNWARPIFAAHNMPAMVYAQTALETQSWALTWQQLRDLQNIYGWEIGGHTITHPSLITVTDAQLDQELRVSKDELIANGLNIKSFATPYGDWDLRVLAGTAKYYESHRGAWGGPNYWPDVYDDYRILCYSLNMTEAGTPTLADFQQWVEDAISHNQLLVILIDGLVDGKPQMYELDVNLLRAAVDYVATRPIQVTTMTPALRYSSNPNLVANSSFTDVVNGWATNWARSDSTNITIDENNHGNVTGPARSAKIVGGADQRELISDPIAVNATDAYLLRMYQNVQDLAAGGWAVFVEEANASGGVVGGQWLGGHWTNFVGEQYYEYKPSSAVVARIQIKVYTEVNAKLTLYVDSVELKKVN